MSDKPMYTMYLEQVDAMRVQQGFMTLQELARISENGNVILDPFSTLISKEVKIGVGNKIYPNVIFEAYNDGIISIGSKNIFFSSTFILADNGKVEIGNTNLIGDGGIRIKANMKGSYIRFGHKGRYINNPEIMGKCEFGTGCQVLGNITIQNCTLEGGEGYRGKDPNERGALLKGFGFARNLLLKKGEVINGQGQFNDDLIELQAEYH